MKILHIIDHFELGGAQTIIKFILETQKDDKDIYCYSLRSKKELPIPVDHPNYFYCKKNSRYSFSTLFGLKKIIKENNIDILHCHLRKGLLFGWLMKKLFLKNIRLIFHEHSCILGNDKIYDIFIKFINKNVELFIAVSEPVKKALIKKVKISPDRITVVHNFVDSSVFNKETINKESVGKIKNELKLSDDEFVIGFFGRLNDQKNCESLFRAVPLINFDKIRILLVGNGPARLKLEKCVKDLNISDKVKFLGYRKDVAELLFIIDLFVLPSHWEGSPMALYEAFAMGKPVIGSNTDGIKDFIQDKEDGLLFCPDDSRDLAEKIETLIKDNELKSKLARQAFESSKKFTLNTFNKEIENIYNNI